MPFRPIGDKTAAPQNSKERPETRSTTAQRQRGNTIGLHHLSRAGQFPSGGQLGLASRTKQLSCQSQLSKAHKLHFEPYSPQQAHVWLHLETKKHSGRRASTSLATCTKDSAVLAVRWMFSDSDRHCFIALGPGSFTPHTRRNSRRNLHKSQAGRAAVVSRGQRKNGNDHVANVLRTSSALSRDARHSHVPR